MVDGRCEKPFRAEAASEVIAAWFEERRESRRPVAVVELFEHLVAEHDYECSYRSVLRYVRGSLPESKHQDLSADGDFSGAQVQSDCGEYPVVDVGNGAEPLSVFLMVFSHSRKLSVV